MLKKMNGSHFIREYITIRLKKWLKLISNFTETHMLYRKINE
jgi:hypothetical protein